MRWLLFLLVPLAGCIDGDVLDDCEGHEGLGVPEPDTVREVTLCAHAEGVRRDLVIHYPSQLEGAPIIIALHGGAGNADNMAEKTQLHEAAPDAIVVYPQGTPAGQAGLVRTWNAAHCCGKAFERGTDDVGFLLEILAELERVEPGKVVVTGHSNGAMMAHRFAAEHPDRVDVLVSVAGTIGGRPTLEAHVVIPQAPDAAGMEVVIIHATDDTHVPFDGGDGEDSITKPRHDLSVAESRKFWEDAGAAVEVIETSGGHGWPGTSQRTVTGAPATPDASAIIAQRAVS